jgi:phosphohistidine phosphatase
MSMKSLLVLRHAKSDWNDPELADRDRPLNKRGTRDAARMGRLLKEENLLPDLIITSTATRARETVQGLIGASGYAGAVVKKAVLYQAAPATYLRVLRDVKDDPQRVMVVGHNPGLEELVQCLTGSSTTMPTATLVKISLPLSTWPKLDEGTRGELAGVWRPRELS